MANKKAAALPAAEASTETKAAEVVAPTAPSDGKKHFEICIEKRLVLSAKNIDEVKKAAKPMQNGLPGFNFIFTEFDDKKEGVRLFIDDKGNIDQVPVTVASFEELRALSPAEAVAAVKGEPAKFVYIPKAPPSAVPGSVVISKHGGAWCDIKYMEKMRAEAMEAMKQSQR